MTREDGGSGDLIVSALKGHIPTFLNPDSKFTGLMALYQAAENNGENWYLVMTQPGFS